MAELVSSYKKTDNGKIGHSNEGFELETINGQLQEKQNANNSDPPPVYGDSYYNISMPPDNDDDGDDDDDMDCCSRGVAKFQQRLSNFIDTNSYVLKPILYSLLIIGYFIYLGFALSYEFGSEGSWRLLLFSLLGVCILAEKLISIYRSDLKQGKENVMDEKNVFAEKLKHFAGKARLNLVAQILLLLGFIVFICIDVIPNQPRNLVSLSGMAFFILSFYIFSFNPSKVKWRPVFWGLAIQMVFGLLALRTTWGFEAFKWLGDRVTEFLAYTDRGAKFVFGDTYEDHFFAFKVLPVVIFFSTFVSILYYLGVMQVMIKLIGKFLAVVLGTSPTESLNAAGNIFIGQTEAPLLIRPFLNDMTESEIHAVMTGGFATIAGSVMAAYILYGVPANHLLTASVMSAPAALAMSKLFYPETEKTRIQAKDVYNMSKGEDRNLIEAASNGASVSISLVANIAANLIAFVALLGFVNHTLLWFGDRVGYGELTFQKVCSYVFWPLPYLMGVEQEDCLQVAELIGTKTFLNEFVAYVELSKYIHNRESLDSYISNATANATHNLTGIWYERDGGIFLQDTGEFLKEGLLSPRSVVISTYALCGFSNIASIGIQLGGLGAMAPNRKSDMAKIVVRAMIAGNVACFMTACISGLLYQPFE